MPNCDGDTGEATGCRQLSDGPKSSCLFIKQFAGRREAKAAFSAAAFCPSVGDVAARQSASGNGLKVEEGARVVALCLQAEEAEGAAIHPRGYFTPAACTETEGKAMSCGLY